MLASVPQSGTDNPNFCMGFGTWTIRVCTTEHKTAVVVVASYRSVSRNPFLKSEIAKTVIVTPWNNIYH